MNPIRKRQLQACVGVLGLTSALCVSVSSAMAADAADVVVSDRTVYVSLAAVVSFVIGAVTMAFYFGSERTQMRADVDLLRRDLDEVRAQLREEQKTVRDLREEQIRQGGGR